MKVHRLIQDGLDDKIKNQAVEVGLDQLDFDRYGRLHEKPCINGEPSTNNG